MVEMGNVINRTIFEREERDSRTCPNPCSVIHANVLVMCQVYVDGKSFLCQLNLNATIVVMNMHPNF